MKKIEKFENQQRICTDIENLVSSMNINYMDALIYYADDKDLEIEYVAGLVGKNQAIRSKIEIEAENLNFLRKKARLPI